MVWGYALVVSFDMSFFIGRPLNLGGVQKFTVVLIGGVAASLAASFTDKRR